MYFYRIWPTLVLKCKLAELLLDTTLLYLVHAGGCVCYYDIVKMCTIDFYDTIHVKAELNLFNYRSVPKMKATLHRLFRIGQVEIGRDGPSLI